MFERFCLDGWLPMNIVLRMQKHLGMHRPVHETAGVLGHVRYYLASAALTVAAALVSPTAHLHFWTGITLTLGYVHARTLDAALLA